MKIRIREQSGTDAVRKFDYQMAVALDCLLSEMDGDALILIETLEDFAVFRNPNTDIETIEVYQVKTKNKGLYTKDQLFSDNVIGKIILTDIYFESKSNSLKIVCNTNLKGASTENFDEFIFDETLSEGELKQLKENVLKYLTESVDFKGKIDTYIGKLVYVKSLLPFSNNEDRYEEMLIGKTDKIIAHYLNNENHQISPRAIFNTLKFLVDYRRRTKFSKPEVDLEEAITQKGIHTDDVKEIIKKAEGLSQLSKKEILSYASSIFSPKEYENIKRAYPNFLACKANLSDQAFILAKETIKKEYESLISHENTLSLNEIISQTARNSSLRIPYYPIEIIQIIAIIIAYGE